MRVTTIKSSVIEENKYLFNKSRKIAQQDSGEETLVNIETIITILFILLFSQAFYSFPLLDYYLSAFTYLLLPYVIFRSINRYTYFFTRDIFVLSLILLAGFSIYWSTAPEYTFHTFRGMFRLAAYGTYFAMRYSLKNQIRILSIAFGISAIFGILLSVGLPSIGSSNGLWKGSFPTKNDTARVMVLSLITQASILLDKQSRPNVFVYASAIASFILLIFARSSTALVVLSIMILMVPLITSLRQKQKVRTAIIVPIIFILIFGGTLVAENYELIIVDILGKDLTLSGRTDLWEPLFTRVSERPLLGFGYNAFWKTEYEWVAANKAFGADWTPTHAHSGFLDLTLSLGFVGLVLFAASFFRVLITSLKFSILSARPEAFWSLQFLVLTLFYNVNITQSILAPENLIWAMYMSVTITLLVPSKRRLMFK